MVVKTNQKTTLVLCTIFLVAFVFRVVILFRSEYPPSTDVGLHSNILNLILDTGEVPTWNPYHMGGEPLTNPPGFYLFASFIVLFTGMPLLMAQMLIAAFFSAFAVFPAYLFSRKMWKSNGASIIAAFFVAVSSLSLEMIGWGGYPNIVSMTLITIVFFALLKNSDEPHFFKLVITALLLGGLALTHLLSFFVLLSVWIGYIVFLHIAKAFKLVKVESRSAVGFFFASLALATLFVSSWALRVWDFYLDMSVKGVFVGGMEENRDLILANRYVDANILIFCLVAILMLFMFKKSRGKYVDSESLLFVASFLVPLALTQAYIFGIITDYLRFMYFVDMPGLLTLAAAVFFAFEFTLAGIQKLASTKWSRHGKVAAKVTLPAILLIVYFVSPLSLTPAKAVTRTEFYTTIRASEAAALDWIQQKTPNQSILVTDHLYGWWLSGLAKRSTLSAVSPEFLLYPNEIEVAKLMLLLLDTDFYIENGLIRIRDDGGYLARHNPMFIAERKQRVPYTIFHFNDSEITLFIQQKTMRQALDLNNIGVFEMHLDSKGGDSAVLSVIRQNNFLTVNKTMTVRRGVRFVELSYEVQSTDGETTINWMRFILHLKEGRSVVNQQMISLLDYYAWVNGKIIFKGIYPQTKIYTYEHPGSAEFLYSTDNATSLKVTFLVGVYDLWGMQYKDIMEMIGEVPENPMHIEDNSPVVTASYLDIIKEHNITHVVCRNQEIYQKFSEDPHFQIVYKNMHVAIFKVVEK